MTTEELLNRAEDTGLSYKKRIGYGIKAITEIKERCQLEVHGRYQETDLRAEMIKIAQKNSFPIEVRKMAGETALGKPGERSDAFLGEMFDNLNLPNDVIKIVAKELILRYEIREDRANLKVMQIDERIHSLGLDLYINSVLLRMKPCTDRAFHIARKPRQSGMRTQRAIA
ncbi:MAG: hypothetical protein WC501_05480 [Candidatus Micrarchaeia archaeon]